MIFLIDCNGECACDKCMIDKANLEDSKTNVKTFPEFYLNNERFIYQRFESSEDKILIVLKDTNIENCKEVGIQLVNLLNNGTIKIEEI